LKQESEKLTNQMHLAEREKASTVVSTSFKHEVRILCHKKEPSIVLNNQSIKYNQQELKKIVEKASLKQVFN
jgi:uncharacterized SAM-dependent methyltransferase